MVIYLKIIIRTCIIFAGLECTARQLDREMRTDVRITTKRPRDAYTDMLVRIPKRGKATDVQADVVLHLPSYNDVCCQLTRHRTHSCILVPDPLSIPDALKTIFEDVRPQMMTQQERAVSTLCWTRRYVRC